MIQRTSLFGILLTIGILTLLTSCETDVDLTADYKSTPVITGILEYTADTQYVRINRTFLADTDVNVYAQNRDSVEYQPEEVEAWLFKKFNGDKRDSILLEHIVLPSRDPGAFYDENVSFWYTTQELFTESEISNLTASTPANYAYELDVTARGKNYKGETGFPKLKDSYITNPPVTPVNTPPYKADFYVYQGSNEFYKTQNFRYQQYIPTYRYQNVMRMYYSYMTSDNNWVDNQFIDYSLGVQEVNVNNPPASNQPTIVSFNPENWYAFIGEKFKNIPGIEVLKIVNLEYRITGGNDILNSYTNVTNPISDFTPVLSTFSNFNNGAIGILGSRTNVSREFLLTESSLEIMEGNVYFPDIDICVDAWSGSNFNNCQ